MPAPQRARFLQNLRTESGRIQTIVDKLLQLAALENRRALSDAVPVELTALLQEALAAVEPIARSRRLHLALHASESVTVPGERFLIAQAVSNLLQNALEFTPDGGSVAVTLQTCPATGRARVMIDDTGPGIPDYALPRLFERFYSLPRPATGVKSTGLGLSFVKEIAHLHGGDITLENRPQGGVRATLSFAVSAAGS
jgi:two-component system sensor histidine kinase CreC